MLSHSPVTELFTSLMLVTHRLVDYQYSVALSILLLPQANNCEGGLVSVQGLGYLLGYISNCTQSQCEKMGFNLRQQILGYKEEFGVGNCFTPPSSSYIFKHGLTVCYLLHMHCYSK